VSLKSELLEVEEAFWESAGNAEFWREHFDDNGLVALSMGLMDKATVIQTQEDAEPWESFSLANVRILSLGEGVASISYRASARRSDSDEYSAVVTSVYSSRNGSWKLKLHQQTPED
jgi:hypothetical protein